MEDFKIDFAEKVAHIEESVKSAHRRIDSIEKLTNSVYELAANIRTMQDAITNLGGKIQAIEEKPAKRWDIIVTAIITTIAGILTGYFFKI